MQEELRFREPLILQVFLITSKLRSKTIKLRKIYLNQKDFSLTRKKYQLYLLFLKEDMGFAKRKTFAGGVVLMSLFLTFTPHYLDSH